MPVLKDVQLRVALVVARQTFGWIEDYQTGKRKEKDWISHSQLIAMTGRRSRAISLAVDYLCKESVILAYNQAGELLDTADKRRRNFGKIFYRFNQNYGENMLLKLPRSQNMRTHKMRSQKVRTTKLTALTKNNNNKYIKKSKREENRKRIESMKQDLLKKF